MPYRNPSAWSTTAATTPACRPSGAGRLERIRVPTRGGRRGRGRYRGIGLGALHRAEHRRAARARRDHACSPNGASRSCSARCPPARATRRASRSSSPSGSGSSCAGEAHHRRHRPDAGRRRLASGRSMRLGAVVMAKASDRDRREGQGASPSDASKLRQDIEFARRRFRVKGTDRSVGLFEARRILLAAVQRNDAAAVLSLRLRGVRGGGRSGHRRGRDRAPHHGRRRAGAR